MRTSPLRTTPAFLIGVLALVVAMGGVGYAAGRIGTADLKNGAVTSPKIRDETIRLGDLAPPTVASLRGATGPAGPAGAPGAPGAPGVDGTDGVDGVDGVDGADGSARAYAHVDNTGTLVAARSSGFDAVTEPANGVYCMTLSDATIDPSTIAPSATVEFSGSSGIGHIVSVDYRVDSCGAGADFTVNTMSFTGASFAWSGAIAFTVLVP
jgi:hypothetical protein